MIELVLALLLCAGLGLLVDRSLLGAPGRGPIERTGRALLFGLGTFGLLSVALDSAQALLPGEPGLAPRTHALLLGAVVVAAAIALAVAHRRAPAPAAEGASVPVPSGRRRVGWAALLLLAAAGLAVAVFSGWVRPAFQFDSLTRWAFKTKGLYFDGTLLGPLSTDPAFALTHQRYPPLVSHVSHLPALLGRWLDPAAFDEVRFDDRIASAIYPWYAVALAAIVYGALARRVGRLTGALGAAWIAHLPLLSYQIVSPPGAGAFCAMADIPLALFVTGAVLAAADAVDRRPRAALEAGLLLGFATLTKNEGLPLLVGLGAGLLLARRRDLAGAIVGLGGLLFALVWGSAIVLLGIPATDENYLGQLSSAEALQRGFERLSLILPRLVTARGGGLLDLPSWNLTWPAVLVLVLGGGATVLRRPALRLMLVVLVVQLASYVYAFMITAWSSPAAEIITAGEDPVGFLMVLTLGRLLMHVAPTAIALALLACPLDRTESG